MLEIWIHGLNWFMDSEQENSVELHRMDRVISGHISVAYSTTLFTVPSEKKKKKKR